MSELSDNPALRATGEQLVERVLTAGVDGVGPWRSAQAVAAEALAATGDPEPAIQRLLVAHRRMVGATGFATSIGGALALVVGLPADVTSYHVAAARLSAAIAHLRGYDLASPHVRSLVLITLLGEEGTELLAQQGVATDHKDVLTPLSELSPHQLGELNRSVGYQLVAKFGQRGAVNLVKLVPFVGGGVGAGVNMVGITTTARSARTLFLPRPVAGRYAGPGVTVIDQ